MESAYPEDRVSPTLRIVMVSLHTSPVAKPGSADAGGMNVVELYSALALASRGHQIDLLTRRDDPALHDVVDVAPGVRLFNLEAGPAHPIAKSAQEVLIEPFRAALTAWWASRGAGVDLVHSHHWFSGVAALPVARANRVPHLQSFHSVAAPVGAPLDAGEQPESPGRPAGEAQVAGSSDLVIAVSAAELDTIVERYAVPAGRIRVLHPGVDVTRFRPSLPDESAPGELGRYLLFAARLQPLKGPDLAIRTLAALPAEDRPRLVVAGAASADFADYEQELHALAASLGIGDQVVFAGSQHHDQLATLMRGAQALLNPSRSETYGLVNLEASASGIPVVASRTGGMVESVVDGVTGVLVDSRDPRVWADEVARLLDDDDLARRLGGAGRQFATTRSWPVVGAQLEAIYLEQVKR